MTVEEAVEDYIDSPIEVGQKINGVSLLIWRNIEKRLIEQCDTIAEDIVFGRISFPKAVEFTCRLN